MNYIGLDTSCYTTSAAVVDKNYNLLFDGRIPLKVDKGDRGLRQSEAVFQHNKNLSKLILEMFSKINPKTIASITVSSKPRALEASYMPVFTVGLNIATLMGSCMSLRVFETTHQQNHVAAGIWSSRAKLGDEFLAYHVSGGTTELLRVSNNNNLHIELVGGSNDLNAGQFIDRVGVALGLDFPCGQKMDKLSCLYNPQITDIPVSVKDSYLSFSGPETHTQRIISKSSNMDDNFIASVSLGVFLSIARSLERTIINTALKLSIKDVLMVGGVMSNSIIRSYILNSKKLRDKSIKIYFSEAIFSSDNAVGTALIGVNNTNNCWRFE